MGLKIYRLVIFITILLRFHYFISLDSANTQRSEVFLLRISSGNVNASVVTCWLLVTCSCKRARLHEMVKKWGKEKFIFHATISGTIYILVKILLVKLKYLYIQYVWITIMKKRNSNQNMKVEKMVVLVRSASQASTFSTAQ